MAYAELFDKLVDIKYSLHKIGADFRNEGGSQKNQVVQFSCEMSPWRYESYGGGKKASPRNVIEVVLNLRLKGDYFKNWKLEISHDGPSWVVESSAGRGRFVEGAEEDLYYQVYHTFSEKNPSNDSELLDALTVALVEITNHIHAADLSFPGEDG